MATNTFVGVPDCSIRPRDPVSYTFNVVGFPGTGPLSPDYSYGNYAISGWVRDASSVPQRRRMVLRIDPGGMKIAGCYSDPANVGNNYFFNGLQLLDGGRSYVVDCQDPDLVSAPFVKDNLTPV